MKRLPSILTSSDVEFERHWEDWLAARNLSGLRIISILAMVLYPLFWLLDYVSAPREMFFELGAIRLVVVVMSGVMVLVVRTPFALRWHYWLAAYTTYLLAGSIMAMVAVLDGPSSPYYAGINLVILGSGLLFLYPLRGTIAVYASLIGVWGVLCLVQGVSGALNNTLFIFATAILAAVGQVFSYRSFRDQTIANLSLERTKGSLERAHDQLKQLDKFKSQFFANITHELKTPLTLIISPIQLLLDGEVGTLTATHRATLMGMLKNGTKLLRLIGDLLDLTKLQESRIRLQVAEHDLVAYLKSLVSQVEPLATRKQIALTFAVMGVKDGRALVHCDSERLERVFVNLLSNAIKFTPDGGKITVTLHDLGDSVQIVVKDNGPGFDPKEADRIFQRFYQVDMGHTRQYGGTGIGLALARELVDLHGGRIWAESAVGAGAAFTVQLIKDRDHFDPKVLDRRNRGKRDAGPATSTSAAGAVGAKRTEDVTMEDWVVAIAKSEDFRLAAISEVTERRLHDRDVDEQLRAHTVLIVEDNPDIIRYVQQTLHHEFRIVAATDGLKGWDLAKREKPSLIITDLMMPGIDGFELVRRLRSDVGTKHLPISRLTARGDLEDRVAGLESGVNAYLAKPFAPKELLTTVRALLETQANQADLVMSGKMSSLETLAGGLAHEINNPLNVVKNAIARIEEDSTEVVTLCKAGGQDASAEARLEKLGARMTKMFGAAEIGIRRIGATVDLMRLYSREGFEHARQPYDLFSAVRHVLGLVLSVKDRAVDVALDLDGVGEILCTPEEIHQVITNLVENAIDATPDDRTPRLELVGRILDDTIELIVTDNGTGIPKDVQARVFSPFFTTKAVGKGTGLGLTIVWRVVTGHKGSVSLTSPATDVGGTCFVLRFPRYRGP